MIAQRAVRANLVVGAPPAFDEHRGFPPRFEALAMEQFVPPRAVHTFDRAILPEAAGFNEQGLYPPTAQPLPNRLRRELRAVSGPNRLGRARLHDELAEPVATVIRSHAASHVDREPFPGVLLHNG